MPNCHEMKKGEVYVCEDCGLELQVVRECKDAGTPAEECGCHATADPCSMSCCGTELVKKQS
jgi:predicted nucleic acid-binding Zn ribbon protein